MVYIGKINIKQVVYLNVMKIETTVKQTCVQ